jgi:hypothetical protein
MRGRAALLGPLAVAALALLAAGPADAARPAGRLVLHVTFDDSAGPYVSGTTPFLAVRTAAGRTVAERRVTGGRAVVTLPPGRYVLASYWRPCGATCSEDDLPTDRCARRFRVRTASRGASETVAAEAVFEGGEPCRLSLASDWPPAAAARSRGAALPLARGPYCRPEAAGCRLPARAPRTRRALAVRAGSRVTLSFGAPVRRLELDGICGRGPLRASRGGRRWSFRVPAETAADTAACGRLGLAATYAGQDPLRGVRAQFGFRLRRGG